MSNGFFDRPLPRLSNTASHGIEEISSSASTLENLGAQILLALERRHG